MRVFLSFCIVVATTVALPTGPCCPSEPPCEPCEPPCQPSCEQSSDDSCTYESSTTISITSETRFVCNKEVYPSIVPPEWNIMTFDTQCVSTYMCFKITIHSTIQTK